MLTDDQGNPIPADDPRLPSAEDLAELQAQVAKLAQVIEANGGQIGPLLDVQAKVETLVSLFVPPDPETPVRRLFEIRVAEKKRDVLIRIIEDMQEARTGPRLLIPNGTAIPKDLRAPGSG